MWEVSHLGGNLKFRSLSYFFYSRRGVRSVSSYYLQQFCKYWRAFIIQSNSPNVFIFLSHDVPTAVRKDNCRGNVYHTRGIQLPALAMPTEFWACCPVVVEDFFWVMSASSCRRRIRFPTTGQVFRNSSIWITRMFVTRRHMVIFLCLLTNCYLFHNHVIVCRMRCYSSYKRVY